MNLELIVIGVLAFFLLLMGFLFLSVWMRVNKLEKDNDLLKNQVQTLMSLSTAKTPSSRSSSLSPQKVAPPRPESRSQTAPSPPESGRPPLPKI